ncbi:MAG: DUF1801 domain-containing protein [Saprospiraceae bacterium]|nr:DUF1801 domain-containing protein [Saprospiraceae bacterium]
MNKLQINRSPAAEKKLQSYPDEVKVKLAHLRSLILETAQETDTIKVVEETLKWGELSYLVKKGSTIRIDWKPSTPGQYALYFKCTSKLVPTFKEVFGNTFSYENNRAIVFPMQDIIPIPEVKSCIRLALCYHTLKHIPRLGM